MPDVGLALAPGAPAGRRRHPDPGRPRARRPPRGRSREALLQRDRRSQREPPEPPRRRSGAAPLPRTPPGSPRSKVSNRSRVDGLGDVVVHAGGQAALAFLHRGVAVMAMIGRRGKPRIGADLRAWPGSRPSPASAGPSAPGRTAAAAGRRPAPPPPPVRCRRPAPSAPAPSSNSIAICWLISLSSAEQDARAPAARVAAAPPLRRGRAPASPAVPNTSHERVHEHATWSPA